MNIHFKANILFYQKNGLHKIHVAIWECLTLIAKDAGQPDPSFQVRQ